jgi:hypothetical protein
MQGMGFGKGTIGALIADDPTHYYCLVEWEESYAVSVGDFLTRVMPALETLGSPGNVRIVFFFDN